MTCHIKSALLSALYIFYLYHFFFNKQDVMIQDWK